ncbi:MAG TPA: PEGA domain-containing protein [Vicinamibacterales bacterium]
MSNTAQPGRWPPSKADAGDAPASMPNVVPIRVESGHDALDSFSSESSRPAADESKAAPHGAAHGLSPAVKTKWLIAFGACFAIGAMAAAAYYTRDRFVTPPVAQASPLMGRAVLNSRPDGAAVLVDGVSRGVTPLELELTAGSHEVVFRTAGAERQIEVKVDGGGRVSENVDMPAPAAVGGSIEIVSDPPGARVTVDGTASGVTPITIHNVAAARHTVVIGSGTATVTRSVDVAHGATSSIFASLAAAASGAATGTLGVDSPVELRILESGQLLGLSNGAPIVLSVGKHQLDLVNEALDFRVSRSVTVEANKSAKLTVAAPTGTLSVNAAPWAEVFVDGHSVGVTPLGALSVPIGSHEIVWRHPQLGDRRRTVLVGALTPARVSMDLTK